MSFQGVRVRALLGSQHGASRLAPEIYGMVLDNIKDSKSDLSNSSLVCRFWLHLCRNHLFSEVSFRSDFARLLSSSPHAQLTVAPYIRRVIIKGYQIAPEDKEFLLKSAFQIQTLKSLDVKRFSWEDMKSPLDLALDGPSLDQLSTLKFKDASLVSFKMLTDLLDSLSVLEELSLENFSWNQLENDPAEERCSHGRPPKQSSLRRLSLSSCHNNVILNWLLYGIVSDSHIEDAANLRRPFPFLVALSLPDILPAEAKLFGIFLTSLGDTLEHLELGILVQDGDGRGVGDISRHLGLAANSNLKTVNIHQITLFQFPSPIPQDVQPPATSTSPLYAWVPSVISTIQSSDVHTVGFHVWFSNEIQLDSFPWSNLSSALIKIGVPKIRFHISGIGRDVDLVEHWVTGRLEDIDKDTIKFDFLG